MQTCAIQHVSRYPRGCGRILEEYNRCKWVNFEIPLQPPTWTTRVYALLKFPNGVEGIFNGLNHVKIICGIYID